MKNKNTIGAFAIVMLGILLVGSVSAFGAFGMGQGKGMMQQDLSDEEAAAMQAFQDSVQQALADNDYEEWKSLMESQLTEDNFNKQVDRYSQMSEMKELQDQIQQAWDDEDYATVKELRAQMQEIMPEKPALNGENCQNSDGECPRMQNPGEAPRQGFFQRFKFW